MTTATENRSAGGVQSHRTRKVNKSAARRIYNSWYMKEYQKLRAAGLRYVELAEELQPVAEEKRKQLGLDKAY